MQYIRNLIKALRDTLQDRDAKVRRGARAILFLAGILGIFSIVFVSGGIQFWITFPDELVMVITSIVLGLICGIGALILTVFCPTTAAYW